MQDQEGSEVRKLLVISKTTVPIKNKWLRTMRSLRNFALHLEPIHEMEGRLAANNASTKDETLGKR